MKPGVAARREAARLVGSVVRSGAFSNRLADSSKLTGGDGALFRFLAYTTLRHLWRIDSLIQQHSDKKLTAIDPEVLDVLRVAVAEILYGRAPSHAVVDSAVESAKSGKSKRAAGFINGLLRSLLRSGWPEESGDPAVEFPEWMVACLNSAWPEEEVKEFLAASLQDAPRQVRALPGVATSDLHPVTGIAGAFEMRGRGSIAGGFVVQDAASVAVGNAVPLQSGDLVLDMAAAPGGKAAHLSDRGAEVVAIDRHWRRARKGAERFPFLSWAAADGRHPPFAEATFDHVLLDAPCSGLGTMRRRPEIRYRIEQEDVDRLSMIQRELLDSALRLVKPGGTVTYSVCTVTPEETVRIVDSYQASPPPGLPGRQWGKGLLLGPHLSGTDGMFISVLTGR